VAINKEKILTLVAEIQKARRQLEEYRSFSETVILTSPEKLNSIKYLFIVAAEASLDICQHLSAKLFAEVPESYSTCFQILSKRNVIAAPLAEKMANLAGLRNLLVHRYWQVDERRVVEHLQGIDALEEYVRVISSYVGLTR
jgi:uncharacterized protein YutE (UPF0331/DUF86 family)